MLFFAPLCCNRKTSIVQFTHKSCNWHFICGFYTNWPLSRANNIQTQYCEALRGPFRREVHTEDARRKKLQSRIKTAINHSCWASFKYKSISIFHLRSLLPSSDHQPKKRGNPRERSAAKGIIIHTILIGLHGRICHFLRYKTRLVCRARRSIEKYVHSKWKLIFSPRPRCDWREMDDDDDDKKAGMARRGDYKLRFNVSFHSITLHLQRETVEDAFVPGLFIKSSFIE